MSAAVSRRSFLATGGALGLVLAIDPLRVLSAEEVSSAALSPNPFLRIGADGKVTIHVARSEMGQGVRTALPMLIAEELDVDLADVTLEQASPGPGFEDMSTGGSDSVVSGWAPLRDTGAAAREMLISAAAAEWNVPRGSCRAERGFVVHASGKKLPYGRLVARAAKMTVPKDPPWKERGKHRLLGTRVARLDGPAIVTGRAVYGLDASVPGMLHAAVARSPVAGGVLVRFDDARTRAIRGVRDVLKVPSGIAVIADSTYAALEGKDALEVTWDEGVNAGMDSATLWKRLEEASSAAPTAATVVGSPCRTTRKEGDVEPALAASVKRITAEYRYPFQAHGTVEPQNTVADARDGACILFSPTQNPERVQKEVAEALSIPKEKVTVHVTLLGGGFGRRLGADYAVEAAQVSKAIGAPVQVVWSREDDFAHDFLHPASIDRLEGAIDAHGFPTAWTHRMSEFHLTMFGTLNLEDADTWGTNPWGGYDNPYRFPVLRIDYAPIVSPVPTGAWRSVTYPPGVFARESFLDELAHAAGADPLRYRLMLLDGPDARVGPYIVERSRLRRVVALAAEKAGWRTPLPKGRGRGIACNIYHGRTCVAEVVEVEVSKDGRVRVPRVVCAVDCGQVINIWGLEGQFESGVVWGLTHALKSEITFAKGRVVQKNYRDFPVLSMEETPKVEVHVVPSERRPGGIGEQPAPPAAAALANAIFAATGRRVRTLPIRAKDLAGWA